MTSMIKKIVALLCILFYLAAFSVAALAAEPDSENVALVRSVLMAISGKGDLSALARIADSREHMDSLADSATLGFFMYVKNLALSEPVPDFVFFSCDVPSPAHVALDMAGFIDASEENAHFQSVRMEGLLPIIHLGGDSASSIDISAGQNPISIFFNLLLYPGDLSFLPAKLQYTSEGQIETAVKKLNGIALAEYEQAAPGSVDASTNEKELGAAETLGKTSWFAAKLMGSNKSVFGSFDWKALFGSIGFKITLAFFVGLIVLSVAAWALWQVASRLKDSHAKKQEEQTRVLNVGELIRLYRHLQEAKIDQPLWRLYGTIHAADYTHAGYTERTRAGWALAALGKLISQNATPASFHRAIRQYEKIVKKYNGMVTRREKAVTQRKNIQDAFSRLDQTYPDDLKARAKQGNRYKNQLNRLGKQVDSLTTKLNQGILYQALKAKVAPFGYLLYVLNDSQFHYDNFMKQGVIMGLLDFLLAHKDHPRIQQPFAQLIAVRAELIGKSTHMSFFEVRVDTYGKKQQMEIDELTQQLADQLGVSPSDSSIQALLEQGVDPLYHEEPSSGNTITYNFKGEMVRFAPSRTKESLIGEINNIREAMSLNAKNSMDDYAYVLGEVLRCANPSLTYCDTSALLETAISEIPGLADLLWIYPLRLIDPGQQDEHGFFEFEPYKHAMWVQYEPPLGQGRVIRRFHEVLDMTIPNSTGLNVRLFTDAFAPIPTMFHEHCHYKGDHNEASVFLRTQVFSAALYRKYQAANPLHDFTFIHLQGLLGEHPDAQHVEKLNELIERLYGKQLPEEQASALATQRLEEINQRIALSNAHQSWHPEVRMPLLNDQPDGDSANARLIESILMRYMVEPRRITAAAFAAIVA